MKPFKRLKDLRENWLHRAAAAMAPRIEDAAGASLPSYRISCGFTSTGMRGKSIGECWAHTASKDNHAEIFITPKIEDAVKVAEILSHEMIHACLPLEKHGKKFQKAARAIGFEKPFHKHNPTDAMKAWIVPLVEKIGAYPHGELTGAIVGAPKKQEARMLKAACETCGYTVRVARKWIEDPGPPHCPDHGEMICEAAE